jgi:hypothetical protein
MIDFHYIKQPPKRYTFEQPRLKDFVESFCKGKTLNLFAGKTILDIKEVRVDINPEMPADIHMDAFEFVSSWNRYNFDTVILDPPYNIRKGREKYSINNKTYYKGKLTMIKDVLPEILNPAAHVIHLGYDTVGMATKRGFTKIAICLVCHGGDHNDTICLVEKFNQYQIKIPSIINK